MKLLRPIAFAAGALIATGCVSTSDFQKAQSQIAELQEELANIKRTASSKEEVQNVNVRIAQQTEMLLKSNATLVAKVDQIEQQMQTAQGTSEQTNHRLDRIAQQMTQAQRDIEELKAATARISAAAAAAATAATATPTTTDTSTPATTTGTPATSEMTVAPISTTTSGSGGDPIQIYQDAYRDYQRGNYDLAIAGFREFVADNPRSDLADNAAYWIGESLFSQKKYREAIEQFDSVVTKHPKSDKVPGALLKKGYAYINLGERNMGVVQLQYVIHEHPTSQESALAKQKLRQLGIETR